MTNEHWLRWAVQRHFRTLGYKVNMKGVRVGNSVIDGEAENASGRVALEIKSGHDDVVRGIGQLSEALANGYKTGAGYFSSTCEADQIRSVQSDGFSFIGRRFERHSAPNLP